ncbi:MAG: 3-oxoacyl-[acyl-carrier-protein] reductase [Candidatus Marinimicrobia bacterium]|nr:3-oxoacyl-[acyl-carrier-protein] reductase [Candidatus Neomarinimicrobiota bacterium]|tara:strand:- start:42229 stop:42972 length:744 start_codon:yes stop_codon:yes gene_type:complete
MFDLKGKTALITGASRGIGRAISEAYCEIGIHVAGIARDITPIKDMENSQSYSGNFKGYTCDISVGKNVKETISEVLKDFGQIDILINNAGITRDTLLVRMSEKQWDEVLAINLKGAFNCTRNIVRPMLKNKFGRIINIGSVVGIMGNTGQANYVASKAGLIGLTKSTAQELAKRNITVNCIAPGFINTDMTEKLSEDIKDQMKKSIPMNRFGSPQDVASLALFLASDEAGYITGQTITVDGGMIMN